MPPPFLYRLPASRGGGRPFLRLKTGCVMNKLDFKTVADAALVAADNLLAEWLPGGKYKGHEYVVCNPLRADHRPNSFSINTHSGLWSDFATGDDGGDLISLYAYLFTGGKQGAALRAVAERLRIGGFEPVQRVAWDGGYAAGSKSKRDDWEPVIPVPEERLNHLSGSSSYHYARNGRPEGFRAVYRDSDGRVLCVVQRFLEDGGRKSDKPFSDCRSKQTGYMDWRNRRIPNPQPLFGLDVLAANPDLPVLLVEGEKCKLVAESSHLLQGWVVMSWLGGCNGWKAADWRPLAGRNVVLWPDCDSQREKLTKEEADAGVDPESKPFLTKHKQPGFKAMLGIAEKLVALDCAVRLVDIPSPGEWPSGYDIADMLGDEPLADVIDMLSDSALLAYPLEDTDKAESSPRPSNVECVRENAHAAMEGVAGADYADMNEFNEDSSDLLLELLENYSQIGLKERAISLKTGEVFSFRQLGRIFGKDAVLGWSYNPKRNMVEEFEAEIIGKRLKLEALAKIDNAFASMITRYIYLDGTTDAFDIKLDSVVSLAAVKAAWPEQFDDWSKSPERMVCPITNYVFEPDLPCGVSFNDDNLVNYINMFRGFPVSAVRPDKPTDSSVTIADLKKRFPGCKNIVGLIEHLCSGNGDKAAASAEWVLNWLACRFIWPERKPATALVFVSETQGVGKSTFGERVIKGLFGDYLRQLDQNALESRFNSVLLFALVTIFEEISPSDERMNIIGKLKNMITSDVIMVERKGRDAEKHSDYNSYIIFSNDERSIPIESNDRRFMVSSCNRKFTDDMYAALDEELKNDGIEEFAAFLCALPLMYTNEQGQRVGFNPHSKPLMTPIKRRMINLNKPGWEAFLDDWCSGDIDVPFITCSAADLWAVYKNWCNDTKTFSMTQKNFYSNMAKRLQDVRTWVKINGYEQKRMRIFVVPHEWMKPEMQELFPAPNTDTVARDSENANTKMDYYGKQVDCFGRMLEKFAV